MNNIGSRIKKDIPFSLLPGFMFLLTTVIMVFVAKLFGPEMMNFSISLLPQLLISLIGIYYTTHSIISAAFSLAVVLIFIPISFYLGFVLWIELGLPY